MGKDAIHALDMLETKDDLDTKGEGRRVTNERSESHGVDDRHDPGMAVAEYLELTLKARPDSCRCRVAHEDKRTDNDQRQREPFTQHSDADRRRKHEIKTNTRTYKSAYQEVDDLTH